MSADFQFNEVVYELNGIEYMIVASDSSNPLSDPQTIAFEFRPFIFVESEMRNYFEK